jgi:hypothetical protein
MGHPRDFPPNSARETWHPEFLMDRARRLWMAHPSAAAPKPRASTELWLLIVAEKLTSLAASDT